MTARRRMTRLGAGSLFALSCMLGATACTPFRTHTFDEPPFEMPESFDTGNAIGDHVVDRWWLEFEDDALTQAIETAFEANPSLRQAFRRLEQAAAFPRITNAQRVPQVSVQGGASRTEAVDRNGRDPLTGTDETTRATDRRYFAAGVLSWEIDLWNRIGSAVAADELRVEASRRDVEETALLLASEIADAWFTIQEQRALLELLDEQIGVGETLLELTELRFSLGDGTALDVLQQRQQLAATRSAVPETRAALDRQQHRLAVLLGQPPNAAVLEPEATLPELPPFPILAKPVNLVETRPDLRAALLRVRAADHDVASAIADRYPRLALDLSYEFSAARSSEIFERETSSILGSLIAPILDGGRRRAEVARRRAIVQEQLEAFGATYLDALREVEDALSSERHQLDLVDRLREQLELSRANLSESRSRYSNGLTDYLSVIVAVQALQELERRWISEHKRLLAFRADLYRATGGIWMRTLEAPPERSLSRAAPPRTESRP